VISSVAVKDLILVALKVELSGWRMANGSAEKLENSKENLQVELKDNSKD